MITGGKIFRDEPIFAEDGDHFIGCVFVNCEVVAFDGNATLSHCVFLDHLSKQDEAEALRLLNCEAAL